MTRFQSSVGCPTWITCKDRINLRQANDFENMPNVNPHEPLLPSLLDRLIDFDPDQSSEPLWRGSYRVDELRDDVRRDLEALLNTRHGRNDLLTQPAELGVSCLTFGLPDFTGLIGGGIENSERVRLIVENAVRNFEPRLTNVSVVIREPENEFDRNIRMTIHAVLRVDPIVELVTFDTTLETLSGSCQVIPT